MNIGLMGFGQIGRQIYDLAARRDAVEITAIVDIGDPAILNYLLKSEVSQPARFRLEGNFLLDGDRATRMLQIDRPREVPWDVLGVDVVVDATGKFRDRQSMGDHLSNGAERVILRNLPAEPIDRIVVPGVNDARIDPDDRMISAGSPTTNALAILLKSLSASFDIECVSMTSVHCYTSDQSLQDYAGSDYRRSRSAAKNIIPNGHEASNWLHTLLPEFEGKVLTSALNVPVQDGCLLDTNLVLNDSQVTVEDVNQAVADASQSLGGILEVVEDPIVSSDVIGRTCSLLYDRCGTIKAGDSIVKTLGWYETLGHAARILDVVELYAAVGHKEVVQ
ncbi:MAG: glyceraldehyde 3-phosphate dehydrogenase NAD-binding domain-containing protein [Pseudomonadota bacterium]